MRIRRTNALLGALLVIGLTLMMYLVMDTINLQLDDVELQKVTNQRFDMCCVHLFMDPFHVPVGIGILGE